MIIILMKFWKGIMTKHALKIWELILLAMILLGFFMLSLNSLKQNSVTIDEFAHLPAGFHICAHATSECILILRLC